MNLRHFLSLCFLLLVATPFVQADEPLQIGSRLELFVDGFLIEKMAGDLSQQVKRPEPKEVVLVTDKPWEGNTCAYYTIFRDGDLYRLYYRGSHFDEKTRKSGHEEVTCYAESKDGIHWTKPNLGLYDFNGSKENNIVWDGIGTHDFVAFKDSNPDCSADALYKGVARGHPRGKRGLYLYQSPNGINWKLIKAKPVITTGVFDSQNIAFWNPHTKQYHEYHRTFVKGVRAIMTGTSKDYATWSEPQLLKYPDIPAEHLYTNAVMPYTRAPHLYIGFPTRYLPKKGQRVEPTFMASRDGVTFKRWLDPVIPESAPKNRDGNRSNYMAWGLVELPDRPNHYSVFGTEAYYTGPDSRLRRFEYRKDGFVAIEAGDKGGTLLTKPIVLGELAERLVINFKTKEGGSVRAGLETTAGKPIADFSSEDSVPLQGDNLNETVKWKGGADLSSLKGKTVRLRFEMKAAELYSLQFQPWLR